MRDVLHTIIKKNSYQDSINLMLLTNAVSSMDGLNKVQIMMATPSNKDIFKDAGLHTEELEAAESNDMAIVIDTEDESTVDEVLGKVDQYLKDQSISNSGSGLETVRTWDRAKNTLPNANMAMISVPGQYAAEEADKALDMGLHVFLFSDNVPMEDEVRLKKKAHEKGLLVMGPDCGTGILDGVPMAFANVVNKGKIGIVGASGTGIQEVSTIIDRMGEGVSHAIGTGGRDLKDPVGAITMMDGIRALENHNQTDIIAIISKPPAKEVRNEVVELLHSLSKPVVTIFLGEKPEQHEGNVYQAYTLAETAQIAVDLAKGNEIKEDYNTGDYTVEGTELQEGQTGIKGLFSGGTLASEAAVLISDALGLGSAITNEDGYVLKRDGHEVVDLGDDKYTQGKPHPMIDPETRAKFIAQAAEDEKTGVILLDFVLGYGSHEDMASALLPSIEKAVNHAKTQGRKLHVAAITGMMPTFLFFMLTWVMVGAFQGFYYGPQYGLSSEAIPQKRITLGSAIINSGMAFGTSLGYYISTYTVDVFGLNWRVPFFIIGALVVLIGIAMALVIKDRPKTKEEKAAENGGEKLKLGDLFKNKNLILAYITIFTAIYGFFVIITWLPYYLEHERGITGGSVAFVSSLVPWAAIPGSILFSWIADKMGKRKPVLLVMLPLSLLAIVSIVAFDSMAILYVALLGYGIFGKISTNPVLVAVVADNAPKHAYGTSFGVYNFIGMCGSILAPYITGYLTDVTGSMNTGFYFAAALLVIGTIAVLFMDESERPNVDESLIHEK
nr:acyl-CoA synthetase FdrA [Virgibacillus halodenitrificans]